MSLIEQWNENANRARNEAESDQFWRAYLADEKNNYEKILESYETVFEGTAAELSEKFDMDTVTFAGFLDGINTSLVSPIELDKLEEQSRVRLEIDFEKLYFNMMDAKADWLYNLEQWDSVLPLERRMEIKKEFSLSKMAVSNKVGRNDPCPCGSGKKYKKCCGK